MDMKEILKSGIEQALQDTINSGDLPAGEYPEIVLEVPPQKEFGDFSTNIAMQSARVARQNPRAIAEALISHMNFDWLERAEVAGAGFINFFLKSDMVYDTLKAILNAGTEYGVQPLRARDTIQVEYVSANPTGPLHVGHGRGAAYGSALVNLLRAAGYNVQSEYYINDAGNQIDNMAISIEYRFQELQGATLVFPPKRNEDGSMPEFDIPEGASRLAETPGFPHQAFAMGANILGLQFHLEADAQRLEQWLIGHAGELAGAGIDPHTIRRDALTHGDTLEAAATEALRAWLAGLSR